MKPKAKGKPETIPPPTAQPSTPPPALPKEQRYEWDLVVVAVAIFGMLVGFCWIGAEAAIDLATLKAQAQLVPTSTSFDCDFRVEGNVQFDGREVDVSHQSRVFHYPLTDEVPADQINVPDFEQFRVNVIDARCSGNIVLPARVLAEVMNE